MSTIDVHDEAQRFEQDWWNDCLHTFGEETKQLTYANRMGLGSYEDDGRWPTYDLGGRSVVDIGGGPVSILLKCVNRGVSYVVDPCDYPEWVQARYDCAGVELRRERGGQPVPVELVLADGSVHPQKGRLDAIERAVDTTTGTLSLQFRFANPNGLIRPGQYGRVRFVLETRKDAMLVPQRAVQELQSLYNVTVVGSDNKLAVKTVTVGPRVGSLWVVEKGLEPGDRVVVEGAQRLKPGTVVTTKDAPPAAEAGSGTAEPLPVEQHK